MSPFNHELIIDNEVPKGQLVRLNNGELGFLASLGNRSRGGHSPDICTKHLPCNRWLVHCWEVLV